MSTHPFFHEASETVRFWVHIDTQWIGASIARQVLHYRYRPNVTGEDPMETYLSHVPAIEEAVRQRVKKGAREPVMVREVDLVATTT